PPTRVRGGQISRRSILRRSTPQCRGPCTSTHTWDLSSLHSSPRADRFGAGHGAASSGEKRIQSLELDAGLARSELPVDGGAALGAFGLQRTDPLLEGGGVRHGPGEAAALDDTDLNRSLVQPAAMLGRGMKLQPVQERAGLLGREGLVERTSGVGVEVV